jgi:pimeloyl-ACP methyl ester carboxylesterase
MNRLKFAVFLVCCVFGAADASALGDEPPQLGVPDTSKAGNCLDGVKNYTPSKFDALRNGGWIQEKNSDTVVVFIHGIWSDAVEAWLTAEKPCAYWPDLLTRDPDFAAASIFVAGYYSKMDSGAFSVDDAVSRLQTILNTPMSGHHRAPLHFKNILFIAHSLGGIVARKWAAHYQNELEDHQVGFVLLGSPARGSHYAELIHWLSDVYRARLVDELQPNSPALLEANATFSEFLKNRTLAGHPVPVRERFETRLPVLTRSLFHPFGVWLATELPPIVDLDESSGGFDLSDPPARVGNTDHLSIVKPSDLASNSHQEVRDFLFNRFMPGGKIVDFGGYSGTIEASASKGSWQPERAVDGSLVSSAIHSWDGEHANLTERVGPWKVSAGPTFDSVSPNDGSLGFVVEDEAAAQPATGEKAAFEYKDTGYPDDRIQVFNGKPVYSSFERVARYVGDPNQQGIEVRTAKIRWLRYKVSTTVLSAAKTDIPESPGSTVVIKVQPGVSNVLLTLNTISGKWQIADTTATPAFYRTVRLDHISRDSGGTVFAFSVFP